MSHKVSRLKVVLPTQHLMADAQRRAVLWTIYKKRLYTPLL
jgi:hypothetical protein